MKPLHLGMICLTLGLILTSCEARKAPPPAINPANAEEAKAWLADLYANYADGSNVTFSPLGDQAGNYFDPDMLILMDKDRQATPDDEVGALDGDPVCDCQDFGSLRADIAAEANGPDTVHATVVVNETSPDFMDGDPPKPPAPKTLVYDLIKTSGGWRIRDISFPQGGTLKGLFTAAQSSSAAPVS
jgi:hypothetical protein